MIAFRDLGRKGRLGNQLFQIASTIGIARHIGEEPFFPADWLYRPYFSVPDSMFLDVIPEHYPESTHGATHLDPRCRDYLQDVNLFLDCMDEIKEYFQPSELAQKHLGINLCSHSHVGVHVRRGDNVFDPAVPNKADYHPVPSLHYYLAGLGIFHSLPIWMFSDDIMWCRENLPTAEMYGDGRAYLKEHEPGYGEVQPTDWMDFFELSKCDAFVLSNSTFGVWAALLSRWALEYPEQVVRPEKVYGPALDYIDANLMYHPKWRVLSC